MDLNGRVITAAIPCRNVSPESRRNRYEISARELVQIQRAARGNDEEILGFYHSHPDHTAQWSETDLEQAYWFGCSYVITSVNAGPVLGETASYLLNGKGEHQKHFEPEAIEIVDS
jgi:proteasome lid subunit RPN8/RPN11